MNKTDKIFAFVIIAILTIILVVAVQPVKASPKFIIASWDFPSDEYGQGIDKIAITENSTGSWLPLGDVDSTRDYDESSVIEFSYIGAAVKLNVYTWFNSTLTGAANWSLGVNYQRHNVTVTNFGGTILFSQQNFTYANCFPAIDPPMWYYEYEVVLDFLATYGEVYTVTVSYEIYYL